MARCRVPVIERHVDPGAPGQARGLARRDRHRADPDRVARRRGAWPRLGRGLGPGHRAGARRRGARESLAGPRSCDGHRACGSLANESCYGRHMRHADKISSGPGSGKAKRWLPAGSPMHVGRDVPARCSPTTPPISSASASTVRPVSGRVVVLAARAASAGHGSRSTSRSAPATAAAPESRRRARKSSSNCEG